MDPSLTPDSPRISVTQLTLTNFNYWHTNLILVASINSCDGHLDTNPTDPTDPTDIRPFTHQKRLALALIFHSLSEEVRALLSDDDLLLSPHDLCNRLNEITKTNPSNAPYLLSALARETTLHPGTPMHEYLSLHKNIRTRMRAVNYPGILDKGTAAQFLLDGLRDHPDYNPIALTLHAQSSLLPIEQIEAHLLHAENYLSRQTPHLANQARTSHPRPPRQHNPSPRGNRNARRPNHWRGKWCSYHGTPSHNTDECISKMREDAHHSALHQRYTNRPHPVLHTPTLRSPTHPVPHTSAHPNPDPPHLPRNKNPLTMPRPLH